MTLRIAGEWKAARSFAQRALDIGSRQSNILSGLTLTEHEVGNSKLRNTHLDLLTRIARDGTAGSRIMDLSASARVALTGPIAANITGESDRLESSVNAATDVLEHPNATTLSINQAHAGLAMVAVISGDAEKVAEKYELMKTWHHSFMFFSVSSDRLLGLLARTMGQLDQAAKHFDDALSFCSKGGYRPELAWASCEYADLMMERNGQRDRAKATGLFEECLAVSNELGMRPLIERVASLQGRYISQTAFPDGLTAREVKVIRLVALGMTDRGIAEELVISPNTVSNHVRSILGKTLSANRTEAAAYAVQQGLTSVEE
jgi:DNA-binding CsgD family transcriptional regulator